MARIIRAQARGENCVVGATSERKDGKADGQDRREGRGYAGDQCFRGREDLDDNRTRAATEQAECAGVREGVSRRGRECPKKIPGHPASWLPGGEGVCARRSASR